MALAWGKFIEPEGGLLSKWQIDDIPNQYRFYDRNVRPWLEEGDNRRAFVIISDAFRFEAAEELAVEFGGKFLGGFKAECITDDDECSPVLSFLNPGPHIAVVKEVLIRNPVDLPFAEQPARRFDELAPGQIQSRSDTS